MRLHYGYASDVGLVRSQNEDSFLAGPGLFAVCDGMGGARAGEVASETACAYLARLHPPDVDHVVLDRAVRDANEAIIEKSRDERAYAGMGTTLTAALQTGPRSLLLGHIGDSRAYLLRDGRLRQLTDDHSLVAEMVRRGQLTPQQAAVHPHRSIITRALGTELEVEADLIPLELESGDRILLCSDGLTGMVGDRRLADLLGSGDDPLEIARSLVKAALAGGGEDNVTVLVILAEGEDGPSGTSEAGDDVVVGPRDRSAGYAGAGVTRPTDPASGNLTEGREDEEPPLDAEPGPAVPGMPLGGMTLGGETPEPRGHAGATPAAISDQPAAAGSGRAFWRSRAALVAAASVLALLLFVAAFAIFNSSVYFVGTADGSVALYNGLPYRVLGVELYDVVEVSSAQYAGQAPHLQERIDSHELVTKEEGQQFIRSLSPGAPASGFGAGETTTTDTTPGSAPSPTAPSPSAPSTTAPAAGGGT